MDEGLFMRKFAWDPIGWGLFIRKFGWHPIGGVYLYVNLIGMLWVGDDLYIDLLWIL